MDIDLVYLWVDGNDPAWRAKKNAYLPKEKQLSTAVAGDCRYVSNDELRYSLRSVERFAPWIRRIYIVTDNQCPAWLDTSNDRVRIIDQKEIIPAQYLPTFNSMAIELNLANIPDLAEHFLYANDDSLFGAPVTPDFFFDSKGRTIVRLKPQKVKGRTGLYPKCVYLAQQLVAERFGRKFTLAPHHNIDSYRKSDFEVALSAFGDRAASTESHRFRDETDLQRIAISYCALARGEAVLRRVGRYNRVKGLAEAVGCFLKGSFLSDSRCIPINKPDLWHEMHKYNPALFTVNDDENATADDRARMRRFLEEMFPDKSAFEK